MTMWSSATQKRMGVRTVTCGRHCATRLPAADRLLADRVANVGADARCGADVRLVESVKRARASGGTFRTGDPASATTGRENR